MQVTLDLTPEEISALPDALEHVRVQMAHHHPWAIRDAAMTAISKLLTAASAVKSSSSASTPPMPDDVARAMFGCTATAIDEALARKDPRDIAMYAMGTLSNAQEYIRPSVSEGPTDEWSVAFGHANTIRQFINIAKYAIDKAVPR